MLRIFFGALMFVFFGAAAMAQGQYKIQPGDSLQIEVLEDQSLNRSVLVLPDGNISLPLIGTVRAAGMSLSDLRAKLVAAYQPNFASKPNVYVTVGALSTATATTSAGGSVYIMGAVNNPGKYTVSSGTTLLQFLAESGGFTRFAATKRIQLRRTDRKTGKTTVYRLNYKAIEDGTAHDAPSIRLRSGDVIVVPERRLFE